MQCNAGVTYTNWGQDICPRNGVLLYAGSVVQTQYPGGTPQCLQDNVLLHMFEVPTLHTNSFRTLSYTDSLNVYRPIRCALCYTPNRTAKFLNLGGTSCPVNWTREYAGVYATQHFNLFTDGVCLNEELVPNIRWTNAGFADTDLDLVGPECNSESCPNGQVPCSLCTR